MKRDQHYYGNLTNHDVITLMTPLLQQAGYHLRDVDGKIDATLHTGWDGPWVHQRHAPWADCQTWHKIIFDVVQKVLGESWPPSDCLNCWKVVVRPQTLQQLFALYDLQRSVDLPSKCGIETRPEVCGLYGGYFYNHGMLQGLKCYKFIRETVNQWPDLGTDVPVFLKRACTEYEHACGPSDQWTITPDQLRVETLVKTLVVSDNALRRQPEHLVHHIHRDWIEWAYANGDKTYLLYTDGQPIYPEYVKYHEIIKWCPQSWEEMGAQVDQGKLSVKEANQTVDCGNPTPGPPRSQDAKPTIVEDHDYHLHWAGWKKKHNYRKGTKNKKCPTCLYSRRNGGRIICVAHEEEPVTGWTRVCDKWS